MGLICCVRADNQLAVAGYVDGKSLIEFLPFIRYNEDFYYETNTTNNTKNKLTNASSNRK